MNDDGREDFVINLTIYLAHSTAIINFAAEKRNASDDDTQPRTLYQSSNKIMESLNESGYGRYDRLAKAREYALQHGWTPLTPNEMEEFWQSISDCTNL